MTQSWSYPKEAYLRYTFPVCLKHLLAKDYLIYLAGSTGVSIMQATQWLKLGDYLEYPPERNQE